PDWDSAVSNSVAITLEPLSAGESQELIADAALEVELDDGLRARIAAAADGNPLFVAEMLAMLAENLVDGKPEQISVPPTIHALLAARLGQLEQGEREVVDRASVVGEEFARRPVLELVGEKPIDTTLRVLVRKELVRPLRRADIEDGYGFRH